MQYKLDFEPGTLLDLQYYKVFARANDNSKEIIAYIGEEPVHYGYGRDKGEAVQDFIRRNKSNVIHNIMNIKIKDLP